MDKEELKTEIKTTESENADNDVKTYTQAEVDKLLQAEVDRRISSAMKKADKKREAAVKEAEKLAKLSEQERYEYELNQREAAIADKERKIAIMENTQEASKALASRGISIDLVNLVVAEDAEDMMANIKLLEKCFKESVNKAAQEIVARSSGSPAKSTVVSEQTTKEEFRKMSLTQQADLFKNNPELYRQLTTN